MPVWPAVGWRLLSCNHSPALASEFITRIRPASSRRLAIASAVKRPCLTAFLFPFGAPGDRPPCIRQRPFCIAGDRHRLPLRVRAPHRGLRCRGNLLCTGLFLRSLAIPSPRGRDSADHCLTARVDVDVLDRDLLLALPAVVIEG